MTSFWSARLVFTGRRPVEAPACPLPATGCLLGRSVTGAHDLALPEDTALSRIHCRLWVDGDNLHIEDVSTNGTWVDGQRIERREVDDGAVLRVGESLLVLRREQVELEAPTLRGLEGMAPAMRTLRASIPRLARADFPVLLQGESGTGRAQVAQSIHRLSGRSGALRTSDCRGMSSTEAVDELRGTATTTGLLRGTPGGTLYLEELSALPDPAQAVLFEALVWNTVSFSEDDPGTELDVRIVASTSKPLGTAVSEGRFRSDLFARIGQQGLVLPPLRDRPEDVLALIEPAMGDDMTALDVVLAERLVRHHWPGNLTELRHLASELRNHARQHPQLFRELVEARLSKAAEENTDEIDPADEDLLPRLPPEPSPAERQRGAANTARAELQAMLRRHQGNVARIAKATGRSPKQIRNQLRRERLNPKDFLG